MRDVEDDGGLRVTSMDGVELNGTPKGGSVSGTVANGGHAKMLLLRSERLPGRLLPIVGGLVFAARTVVWPGRPPPSGSSARSE